jgi:hypothetical protein
MAIEVPHPVAVSVWIMEPVNGLREDHRRLSPKDKDAPTGLVGAGNRALAGRRIDPIVIFTPVLQISGKGWLPATPEVLGHCLPGGRPTLLPGRRDGRDDELLQKGSLAYGLWGPHIQDMLDAV